MIRIGVNSWTESVTNAEKRPTDKPWADSSRRYDSVRNEEVRRVLGDQRTTVQVRAAGSVEKKVAQR